MSVRFRHLALGLALVAIGASPLTSALAAQQLTSPQQFFGHDIGADYVLPNYSKFHEYWIKLANESDRMELDTIGVTAEGTVHHYPRPGVVFVPIDDAPAIEVHLAWHRRYRHPYATRVALAIRAAYEADAAASATAEGTSALA